MLPPNIIKILVCWMTVFGCLVSANILAFGCPSCDYKQQQQEPVDWEVKDKLSNQKPEGLTPEEIAQALVMSSALPQDTSDYNTAVVTKWIEPIRLRLVDSRDNDIALDKPPGKQIAAHLERLSRTINFPINITTRDRKDNNASVVLGGLVRKDCPASTLPEDYGHELIDPDTSQIGLLSGARSLSQETTLFHLINEARKPLNQKISSNKWSVVPLVQFYDLGAKIPCEKMSVRLQSFTAKHYSNTSVKACFSFIGLDDGDERSTDYILTLLDKSLSHCLGVDENVHNSFKKTPRESLKQRSALERHNRFFLRQLYKSTFDHGMTASEAVRALLDLPVSEILCRDCPYSWPSFSRSKNSYSSLTDDISDLAINDRKPTGMTAHNIAKAVVIGNAESLGGAEYEQGLVIKWTGALRVRLVDGNNDDISLTEKPGSLIAEYLQMRSKDIGLPITITTLSKHDNNVSIILGSSKPLMSNTWQERVPNKYALNRNASEISFVDTNSDTLGAILGVPEVPPEHRTLRAIHAEQTMHSRSLWAGDGWGQGTNRPIVSYVKSTGIKACVIMLGFMWDFRMNIRPILLTLDDYMTECLGINQRKPYLHAKTFAEAGVYESALRDSRTYFLRLLYSPTLKSGTTVAEAEKLMTHQVDKTHE